MKIVGIGASAGGVDALRKLLSGLSSKTGAAFVIVQHLSPDFKSVMAELLQKYTDMPVREMTKSILPEANHIYLMPGNKTLSLQYGMLNLYDRSDGSTLNLPIDKFFHSLGAELKNNAVGIILSGSGTDGSRGARTIKENAGIMLVQSPDSAEFESMPESLIQLDIADEVLPPEEIGQKLAAILKSKKTKTTTKTPSSVFTEQETVYEKIIEHISTVSGVDFSEYKPATLQRRMEKQMLLHNIADLQSFYDFLLENEDKTEILWRDFLISVTRFFRDKDFFREVDKSVIPRLFANLKADEPLRVWVPACSTGEEAYTFGILLFDYIKKHNLKRDFKIFASDVNKKSIEIASQGLYFPSILADVPPETLGTYFSKEGDCRRVKANLREKIIFAVHNVLKDPPFINMNLISCRNFLIYLKPPAQEKVLRTFYFSLKNEQNLLLGPSESLGELSSVFKVVNRPWNIYEKEEGHLNDGRFRYKPTVENNEPVPLKPVNYFVRDSTPVRIADDTLTNPFTEFLLEKFAPKTMVINRDTEILYLNGDWEKILSLPKALTRLSLDKMLPKIAYSAIADGLRLTTEANAAQIIKNVPFSKNGQNFTADLSFEFISDAAKNEDLFLLTVLENNRQHTTESGIRETDTQHKNYENEKILRLEKELEVVRGKLKSAEKVSENATRQLNLSNQKLLTANEELQSTNEELQSINEELHTVNTELQMKNKQLITASDDISNLLKTTDVGAIFLDKKLRIRMFTPAVTRQFDIIETDYNRPITAFANKLKNLSLEDLCRSVLDSGEGTEREVQDRNGHNYLLRIFPYRTHDKTDGVVLTLIDINDISLGKRELYKKGLQFDAFVQNTDLTVLHLNGEGVVTAVNKNLDGYTAEEITGKNLFEVLSAPADRRFEEALQEVRRTGKESVFDLKFQKKSKEEKFRFRINPIKENLSAEKITAFIVFAETNENINRKS